MFFSLSTFRIIKWRNIEASKHFKNGYKRTLHSFDNFLYFIWLWNWTINESGDDTFLYSVNWNFNFNNFFNVVWLRNWNVTEFHAFYDFLDFVWLLLK